MQLKRITPKYQAQLFSPNPNQNEITSILPDYTTMVISVMQVLAQRYKASPDYPFIDMKLNLMNGQNFDMDDPIGGKDIIYGFIQGRGLEAVAGHCRYLEQLEDETHQPLLADLRSLLAEVLASLRQVRARNGGHAFFFLTPEGQPFKLDKAQKKQLISLTTKDPWNVSDLFCAKGMLAAASYLNDASAAEEAFVYSQEVAKAILENRLSRDQQPLDPKNKVVPIAGRHSHSPYMLGLGLATLMLETGTEGAFGFKLIDTIFKHYVNTEGQHKEMRRYDYWEFVTDTGAPYVVNKAIPSDPGHALEFVGLAFKFLRTYKQHYQLSKKMQQNIASYHDLLPRILVQNFENGYNKQTEGIYKLIDLVKREPLNSDMPWWNLPETIRAAAYAYDATQGALQQRCLQILASCHNAFTRHYVQPELQLMAVQTRSATGEAVAVIPATADADPGYHTGLSLLDVIAVFSASPNRHRVTHTLSKPIREEA